MPIIKSAKKRVRVTKKATARNRRTKSSLKSALKAFTAKPSAAAHSKSQSAIDTAVKKGLIHKNKAARQKRRLSAAAKKAGVKPTASIKKTPAKKVVAKKSASKKPLTKKPVAKKAKK